MKRCLLAALATALAAGAPAWGATPAVSSGNHHSVALHADGTVRTWGDDSSGQLGLGRTLLTRAPAPVLGLSNVAQVSSGFNHVVALLRDGTVWAWGVNGLGQLGDGTTTNRSTPAPVEGLTGVIEISAGYGFTLALKGDGTVWSWGENYRGQLGYGYDESRRVPLHVPGLPFIRHIAAGGGHSLALSDEGIVWGWGANDVGQLGDGTLTELYTGRTDARPVVQLSGVATISAGGQFSVAATVSGLVYAWGGSDDGGLIGSATIGKSSVPVLVVGLSGVTALSAGVDHTLALLNDRTVMAWGNGYSGQLGDGQGVPSPTPVRVAGLANVERIETGFYFSVARASDGGVWAWGDNTFGEMADGTTDARISPQRIGAIPAIDGIAAGGYHAFGVALDGRVYAWGANDFGELGDGVKPLRSTPAVVPGATSVASITGGGTHTAARKSDGTVWTWGYNYGGLLGLGDQDGRDSPTQVPGLTGITGLSMGPSHTLAIASDGTLRAWGGNGAGELGDGTTIDRHSPITVAGIDNVKQVAAGGSHSLALKNDGTVWAWGENYSGELGDGTNTRHAMPAIVPGLSGVAKIAAGDSFSFAVKTDGTVVAWGADWDGQLGDGTGYSQTRPVPVARLRDIEWVSGGGAGAMALKRDGTVSSWGSNIDGRLGDGTFVDRDAPVTVLREDGAGTLESNDWFLDLNPAIAKTIASDLVPVFLVVTANAAGEVTAKVRFRGQDVGTTASVFAFALAPANVVKRLSLKDAMQVGYAKTRDGAKDTPTPCVLAQLVNGQLQQVSASTLQAYVSGVLGSQGQSVTLLNSASAANAAGATFFVGYGANGSTMIASGLNRSAVTVPGSVTCQPQPPQTGWWWNPLEGGRGYSIEVQGGHIFFAAFHYDASGRSTWNVASGATSLDGSLFTGDLLNVRGGQTLGGPYGNFPQVSTLGAITLAFSDASHGLMNWPGGTVPIERQNIVTNGLSAAARADQPENGWWWNPQESGRGFFIEWQGDWADLAGYMYDDAGNPVWYISVFQTPDTRQFSGAWWSYANGQSMGGAYQAPTQTSNNVAPVTVRFSAPDTAIMTLPNGRTTALTRQRF